MKKHTPGFLRVTEAAKAEIREITPTALLARFGAAGAPVLVDVREDREWQDGHVPGSVHLGKGVLERDVEQAFPELDTELVLMCGGGFRSALAARSLQEMGYTRVTSLAGGLRGWKAANGPYEPA